MQFLHCLIYLVITGIAVFFIGRILPHKWIRENTFPFKAYDFENNGRIYDKLKISKWKDKMPDASKFMTKIFPRIMKKKKVEFGTIDEMKFLLKETCIAELAHIIAAITGLACFDLWGGFGGLFVFVANMLFNMIFIVIQRYNRPRLRKMIEMLVKREEGFAKMQPERIPIPIMTK